MPNLSKSFLGPAFLIASSYLLATTSFASWDAKLELETVIDANGNSTTAIEPRIRYKKGNFKTHIEYEYTSISGSQNDRKLEWEISNTWKLTQRTTFKLTNELSRNFGEQQYSSELTPSLYTKLDNGLSIGFDLEIDYLKNDDFDLYEIEIEPTIKWGKKLGKGKLSLELEAPVMRLYSKEKKNFEFEEILPIIEYKYQLSKRTSFEMELELPYDLQEKELSTAVNIALTYQF